MKKTVKLPKDDEKKSFPLVPEGERKFQITDILSESDQYVQIKCECIPNNGDDNGLTLSLLYRVALEGDFMWLTKLFLKCIDEHHHDGDMEIDTEAWIGRQFVGEVKHKDGYANIKKLIYQDIKQFKVDEPKKTDEVTW